MFSADDMTRGIARGVMQPARQNNVLWKAAGFFCKVGKHELRNIFRQLSISTNPPKCCRMNQVDIATNQMTKGFLRAFFRVVS